MIKTLLNTLKQDKETFEVPRSVQDAIPIRRLWPDGVFQFGSKFSKTLRFSDINYAIASKEDKTAMFLDYSELLNALDAGSTTKITINNKRVARENVEQEILIPRRDDHLDGYRAEYNTMLLDKATNAANSVVQERYITFSVHRKSAEEARSFFDRTMHDVTAHLHRLDSHCEELDAVERLRVLHDFYRPGEENGFRIDLRDCMRKGHSFKDAVCPDSLEFKKDHFIMGNKYGRVLFLKEYNKIRANADIVLKPALTQLDDLERALQRENPAMLEINRAIAQVAEQSHNISKLQTAGLLDADACAAKLSSIQIKLTQLRRERRRLLEHDDIEDAISRLHQTADTIKSGPEQLDTFDESLFEELVERIIAESQTCIRFRLWGGVELTEEVRRAKR